ncbi:FecR family protein [Parabacteroides pacaensis]|uniref:FecR family protein n=1 Tax=Parabacteroides pacaensis TaxID=2086575 RepID=UPI000D0EAF9A|nr:FecR family protein [Parabacteroides pacaensis]
MSTFSKINSELITKYIKKQLTAEERSILIKWLEEDPDNQKLLFDLKEIYVTGRQDELLEKADTVNEWDKLYTHMKRQPRQEKRSTLPRTFLKWTSAAAVLLLFFFIGTQAPDFLSDKKDQYFTIETKAGEQTSINLADGTTVKLNSMSKIMYPATFNEQNRVIYLEGEAMFDVKHTTGHQPFRVNVKEYAITVLGTRFNISAYSTDSVHTTTLKNGKVKITGLKDEPQYTGILSEGKEFVYQRTTGKHYIANADMEYALGWTNGQLIFKNSPLNEVITSLQRKFGYAFFIQDNRLKELTYTATIEKESLPDILQNMSVVTPRLAYQIDHRKQRVYLTFRN